MEEWEQEGGKEEEEFVQKMESVGEGRWHGRRRRRMGGRALADGRGGGGRVSLMA